MLHTQEWQAHDIHHHQNYSISLALNAHEVKEAQRLRYRVFVEELGARIQTPIAGVDADRFDRHCEHLIVRDTSNAGAGRVVGTYRILTPEAASRAGNYYSESEFDLTRLRYLRDGMVEVGRSCIHPDYRNGTVIALLWSKLAEFMARHDYRTLIGCASVSMADGGHNAANLFVQLLDAHLAPLEYRVFPREPLPFERLVTGRAAAIPPLLKGYLRAGAWVCGEPAWNADFNTADLPLLLPMSRLTPRYARHLVRG
ncbi:MAG: GNAT family N-acetyltransferase [Gammaproteobacteria bacterium]|nr:GNAT family N-acetyltransferase [Rhodocyclaceae bacterium]MBU3908821.1 GNAT family N-acetyltransferase [Gammaproteobacteria bacterium]MBU3988430.1 GNAT family N-acetyltransferase [Gammaproteobacteria bacterium]MBU4003656.1 GNAT family N-acetyltransferase [Gammaproteobacteria bacterium]MBU4021770.1 GNAT family N-acetyltransferase [Gammaproteobacteria bacterium]